MRLSNVLVAATFAVAAAAAPASASVFTLTGDTTAGPTFNRPVADGNNAPTSLSGVGTAVAYNTLLFSSSTSEGYTFLLNSLTSGYDTYLGLYAGTFNPASPLTNALIYNDDLGSTSASGFNYNLVAGQIYTVVITGFGNDDFGQYQLNIAPTAAVPEPAAWGLVIVGLGLAGVAARRRVKVSFATAV